MLFCNIKIIILNSVHSIDPISVFLWMSFELNIQAKPALLNLFLHLFFRPPPSNHLIYKHHFSWAYQNQIPSYIVIIFSLRNTYYTSKIACHLPYIRPYDFKEHNGDLVKKRLRASAKLFNITTVCIAGTLNLKKYRYFGHQSPKKQNRKSVSMKTESVWETEMEKANIFIVFSPVSLLLNCILLKKEFIAVCDLTGFVILTPNLKGKISEVQCKKVQHRPALAFWSCAHVP